jgi:hypothetical protein
MRALVLRKATHQAEASGPLGRLDMTGLGRPTHRPFRGDACGPLTGEKVDKLREQPVGVVHLETHGLPQGEVVLKGLV